MSDPSGADDLSVGEQQRGEGAIVPTEHGNQQSVRREIDYRAVAEGAQALAHACRLPYEGRSASWLARLLSTAVSLESAVNPEAYAFEDGRRRSVLAPQEIADGFDMIRKVLDDILTRFNARAMSQKGEFSLTIGGTGDRKPSQPDIVHMMQSLLDMLTPEEAITALDGGGFLFHEAPANEGWESDCLVSPPDPKWAEYLEIGANEILDNLHGPKGTATKPKRSTDRGEGHEKPIVAQTVGSTAADPVSQSERLKKLEELTPAVRTAYWSWKYAVTARGTGTDKEAYEWLKENGLVEAAKWSIADDYTLPSFETWTKQVRQGRKVMGESKYNKRAGRTGRSIAQSDQVEHQNRAD